MPKNNVLTVIAADLHISEDRRYADTANLLMYILEQISRVLPKYFIILGDIFDKRRPSPRELRLLNKWLLQMLERVENVILLEGNHDLDRDVSALSYLQDLVVPGVQIVRPPFKLNGFYFDHLQLVGALADNGIALNEGKVLSKVIEDNPDCHTFAFGHLHKPQVLQEKPLAFYAGSLDKISFAEVDDKKRLWVFDGDELQSCIDLPTRPMYQYNQQVVEGVDLETPWNNIDVSGAMIKIVFSGTREVLKTVDSARIHKDLVDRGVFSLKIVFDVTNKSVPRNEIINESVTEQAALEEYFKDHFDKALLVAKGLQLIKEIVSE